MPVEPSRSRGKRVLRSPGCLKAAMRLPAKEVRHLQHQSAGWCDHCGALGRVAIAQEAPP